MRNFVLAAAAIALSLSARPTVNAAPQSASADQQIAEATRIVCDSLRRT